MHPLLSDRRRLLAALAVALPLAAGAAAFLMRGPEALPAVPAVLVAVPLALAAVVLLLPVWYVCRALPIDRSPFIRLLATHGVGAFFASVASAYLGAGLVRLAVPYFPGAALAQRYDAHLPGIAGGGALLYLLSVAFHYVLLALEATRRAEQQSMELAVLAREAELRALKAQIHPHFLFNSLNSISALVTADPARAREMCVLLAEFFRKTLAVGERPSVSLDEELGVAGTYLCIERLRLGHRLNVEEIADAEARACRVPPLLLQPLVENAVRHGIATRVDGGLLRIEARTDGRRLEVRIDNPFDPESPARPGVGLGIENVRRRLLARYDDRARIETKRAPERFEVILWLPAEVDT